MPRMIDVIRSSGANSNVMQTAARGALSVPPEEMLEILVYLATQTKIFAERARLTLAGWDESSSRKAAADPKTPKEVLAYLITPGNLRPTLLPALLENPSVSETSLAELAAAASRYMLETLVKSPRIKQSQTILSALSSNPHLNQAQSSAIAEKLASFASPTSSQPESAPASPESVAADLEQPEVSNEASPETGPDEATAAYLSEHGGEISAEGNKPFQPIGGLEELPADATALPDPAPVEAKTEAVASSTAQGAATAARKAPAPVKKAYLSAEEQRGSALQKISKLGITGRIQLAMKGNKEERSLLIRDGTKIVALAVLESPKLTDSEVEKFANQKNVLEAVLRGISMKRRFMKQYAILRNLTFNPRTPIDVSLGLVKHLLTGDLKNLAGNKEVSDTVRKIALRMFRQKLDVTKSD
jgi:hypothetical protein